MDSFLRFSLFLLVLWAHLGQARRRSHHHQILANAPKKLSKNFLEQYAKKSVDEFNKQSSSTGYKYVLLDVIGGRAVEETKTLEIMAKFGRTRCQKTEDRYFCQTTPEMRLEEKLFKVGIRAKPTESNVRSVDNKTANNATSVEFNFEEKQIETLPLVKKLFINSME